MQLHPLEEGHIELVASWMAARENYQWLDFGAGTQVLTPVALKVMAQRDLHHLRLFTTDDGPQPIGIVALTNIVRSFGTATLWYVLGDKGRAGKGYTSRAVSGLLTIGFRDLGVKAVNAWAVESNEPSVRVLERNRFQLIGRQRQCHWISGQSQDRLLFDLLAHEHQEG